MLLEEVLPAFRKGKTIARPKYYINGVFKFINNKIIFEWYISSPDKMQSRSWGFDSCDFCADDWEILD